MKKFKDAFNGLKIAFNHKAVRIQLILALIAIIAGIIIKLDTYEWLSFIICISLVISLEIFNTTIEKIGDYLNLENDHRIKVIKDLSSAAVLFGSFGALLVALVCFFRRILL